jgi:Tfp pilus assembly protein PilX
VSTDSQRPHDERGSALILALAFVFAVGLLILALASLTSNSMLSTSNARAQRTSLNDAETATMTAMQYLRSNYGAAAYDGGITPQSCLPASDISPPPPAPPSVQTSGNVALPSSDPRVPGQSSTVSLWCVGNYNPTSSATRVVDFYACRVNTTFAACTAASSTSLILHAQVSYNDFPSSGVASCGPTSTSTPSTSTPPTCGTAMNVNSWDIATTDS